MCVYMYMRIGVERAESLLFFWSCVLRAQVHIHVYIRESVRCGVCNMCVYKGTVMNGCTYIYMHTYYRLLCVYIFAGVERAESVPVSLYFF